MKMLTTLVIGLLFVTQAVYAAHSVRGYYRSNGTYVAPHMSMDPGESQATGLSYHNDTLVPQGDYSDTSNSAGYLAYPSNSNSYAYNQIPNNLNPNTDTNSGINTNTSSTDDSTSPTGDGGY